MKFFANLLASCAILASVNAGADPMLQVSSDGILTGAKNVEVLGNLYDVRFADGSCNSLFNGCVNSSFTITTWAAGIAAAQALLDQVFVDGPAGQFDSQPSNVFGCTINICESYIPYAGFSPGDVFIAHNIGTGGGLVDSIGSSNRLPSFDTTGVAYYNFAIFTLSAEAASVPEPHSLSLLGLAIAGLSAARRRQKNS